MQRIGIDARALGRGLGMATFVSALAGRLSSMPGREVVLFGPDTGALPDLRRVWPAVLHPYVALDSAVGRVAVSRVGIDVMHFTANSGWWRPGPAPFVLTIHDVVFANRDLAGRSIRQRVGHAYWRRAVRFGTEAASAIACPSRATAEGVQRVFDLPELPSIIPNGVDPPAIDVEVDRGPYVLIFAARDPRKRVDLAIEGWRRAKLNLDMHVLAGAGLPPGFEDDAADEIATCLST